MSLELDDHLIVLGLVCGSLPDMSTFVHLIVSALRSR